MAEPRIYFGWDSGKPMGDRTSIVKCTEFGDVLSVVEATVQDLAKEYVELLDSPANGWGQHVHPIFGQSHHLLRLMWEHYGRSEADAAIDQAMKDLINHV